jgi:hypothetical protein
MSAEDKHIAYFSKNFSWNLCCKQATYLLLKKEELQKLSFKEETALKFHMRICKFCRAFKIQSAIMNEAIKQGLQQVVLLPQADKDNLKRLINSNLDNNY